MMYTADEQALLSNGAVGILRFRLPLFFRLSFLLFFLSACNSNQEKEKQAELEFTLLTTKVAELERRLESVEGDLTSQRARLQPPQSDDPDQVVTEVTYKPNESYLDDPFIGGKRASVLVMVFSNYQCKPCRLFHKTTFQELRERYVQNDDVRLVLRDFPLETNSWSVQAASLAHCAGEGGGYWRMFDLLNEQIELVDRENLQGLAEKYDKNFASKLSQCVLSKRYDGEIEKDRQDGLALGAKGAPGTFVGRKNAAGEFEGVFIRGAQPAAFIDQEIRKAVNRKTS